MAYVPYITTNDYLPTIQSGQLFDQILDALNAGSNQRKFAESWAIGKIRGTISVQYDVDFEITPTLPYDNTKQYHALDRIILDYDAWISGKVYVVGNLMTKDGFAQICIQNNSDVEFDDSKWQVVGNQYDIYYIALPFPRFSINIQQSRGAYTDGYYNIGDFVWWENHTYKCKIATILIDHETSIQFNSINDIPPPNVFPNDPTRGGAFWEDLGEYIFDAGQYPYIPANDGAITSIWTCDDNRDPIFIQAIVDLALWRLHDRISPMNIPKLREDNKNSVFLWLSNVKQNKETVNIPELQPMQGQSFSFGGKPKVINGYE